MTMHIKLSQLQIEEDDPFKHDALNRKESAEILTQFISTLDEPYVIAVDSPWGSGKTTFLKMWKCYLKEQGFHTLYFNAWETDFNDDGLIALIKEIELNLTEFDLSESKLRKAQKHLQKAEEFGISLLKKTIPATVKLATYGVLDLSQLTEDTISRIAEETAKEQFEQYENSKKSLNKFRENLQKFTTEINNDDPNKPLVFIIDELDRCRPNYAIQVLEKAKHLFSTKNLIFVLGIDKKQIGYSIETLYGKGMDTNGYLSRFIDLDYHLPKPDIKTFVQFTLERHNVKPFFEVRKKYRTLQYDKETIEKICLELFSSFNFSLRDIEQIISQLTIVVKLTKKDQYLLPELLCFMLSIRRKHPKLYDKIKNCEITPEVLFTMEELDHVFDGEYGLTLKAYLEVFVARTQNNLKDTIEKYKTRTKGPYSEKETIKAKKMFELISNIVCEVHVDSIDYLTKKIEIAERFE